MFVLLNSKILKKIQKNSKKVLKNMNIGDSIMTQEQI